MNKCMFSLIALICASTHQLQAQNDSISQAINERGYNYKEWVAYGTCQMAPYCYLDNPDTNLLGMEGETRLPYCVPEGHELVIDYMQIEGPAGPQVGMALWLGEEPCLNSKCIISCTTAGGSNQLWGMDIRIPAGSIVNIRVMNNTKLPWVNGFYLQGYLKKVAYVR